MFVVEKVGAQVDDVVVGDHVYCMGKHTSHQRVSREKVLPLPEGLIPELGTFARIAREHWHELSDYRRGSSSSEGGHYGTRNGRFGCGDGFQGCWLLGHCRRSDRRTHSPSTPCMKQI